MSGDLFFFFFFFSYLFMPAEISIPAEIGRNWLEWPKLTEMGRNFFRGGIRGFLIPVCTPVRDFPTVPAGTKRYIQLWILDYKMTYLLNFFFLVQVQKHYEWNSPALFLSIQIWLDFCSFEIDVVKLLDCMFLTNSFGAHNGNKYFCHCLILRFTWSYRTLWV